MMEMAGTLTVPGASLIRGDDHSRRGAGITGAGWSLRAVSVMGVTGWEIGVEIAGCQGAVDTQIHRVGSDGREIYRHAARMLGG